MDSRIVAGLDELHLPRLLLADLPSGSGVGWSDLEDSDRVALEGIHEILRKIRDNPECADMTLFGGIARNATKSADEAERAAKLLRPLFTDTARILKADVTDELKKFVHPSYWNKILPKSRIPNDAVPMLRLAFPARKPTSTSTLRQMWECRLLYYMSLHSLGMHFRDDPSYRAQLLSMVQDEMGIDDADNGRERLPVSVDSDSSAEFRTLLDQDDEELIIDFLLRQDLIEDRGEDEQWSVYLDSEDEFRHTRSTVGTIRRRFKIRVCQIKGSTIKFGVQTRRKRLFSRWRKWVTRIGSIGQFTPDQLGGRLIFRNNADYAVGQAWFGGSLRLVPGGVVPRRQMQVGRSSAKDAQSSSTSPHASTRFLADRMHLTIGDRLVELQLMTEEMAANVTYSIGDESNLWYGARQFLQFLPILRPESLYGIDWNNPEVKDKNQRKVLEDIYARLGPM